MWITKPWRGPLPRIGQSERSSLAARFWPGPLTLVLKKAEIVPDLVTAGLDSVGIRVPSHPVALELIRRAGSDRGAECQPLHAKFHPQRAAHVRESLGDTVDMVLDGWAN